MRIEEASKRLNVCDDRLWEFVCATVFNKEFIVLGLGNLRQREFGSNVMGNYAKRIERGCCSIVTTIEMELDRRTFVRDVMIDRWLAGGAIVVSLASLVISMIALSQ